MEPRVATRKHARAALQERASHCLEAAFVRRRIAPLLREAGAKAAESWSGEVIRAKSTGRVTLRYRLDGITAFAKIYDSDLGSWSYLTASQIVRAGFGPTADCRIPDLLGFLAEENMVLLREAPGVSLADMIESGDAAAVPGARAAAHWLARLHAAELPELPVEAPCERTKIFKLADMLGKAAAGAPGRSALILDYLQRLRRLAPQAGAKLTPTHGQFTPANVYIDGKASTVIDLDRFCLSDPAKDVAIFLHRTTSAGLGSLSRSQTAAEIATAAQQAFLEEYRSLAPANLASLPYYRVLFCLKGLSKFLKDARPEQEPVLARHTTEIERLFLDSEGPAPKPVSRTELESRAAVVSEGAFIESRLPAALVREGASACHCRTAVVQNTGTGRLTLRYEFPGLVLHAKLYTDDLGAHCAKATKALWEGGFGAGSRYQVPELIAFDPAENLLVMRAVPGTPLGAVFAGDTEIDLVEGSRQAARWLARLHRSPLRLGTPDADWDSLKLFRVCVRLIKAAAAAPAQLGPILELLHVLRDRVRRLGAGRSLVQTHGRFHHDHVFLSPECTAVIDLDRCHPSDPSKDAAEFVRVLRSTAFRTGFDMALADRAVDAFLGEYLSQVPEAAATLGCYWCSFALLSLLGALRKGADDEAARATVDFYRSEMEAALKFGE